MKPLFFLLILALVAGCATDSQGRRETSWEAVQRWDNSMNTSIERWQDKTYRD